VDPTELFGTLVLDEDGHLPDGEHPGTWAAIAATFGEGARRTVLLRRLLMLLQDLRSAGVSDVWLDGSFVTSDPEPGDFDVCWNPIGATKSALPPEFGYGQDVALDPQRSNHELLKLRYGGDVFVHLPPFADFVALFRQDREGQPRGIVKVDMESLP